MSSKYNNNKKHGNVFKNWLCPSFLLLPKKSELPKLWGGCSPPRAPGPYAYVSISFKCECHIIMQIQYTKNLNLRRFELGTTLS